MKTFLAALGAIVLLTGCYNTKTITALGETHHCQEYSDGSVNCVNWANGKYNTMYHSNCNEITCDLTKTEK